MLYIKCSHARRLTLLMGVKAHKGENDDMLLLVWAAVSEGLRHAAEGGL